MPGKEEQPGSLIAVLVVLLMAETVSRFVERPAMKWIRLRLSTRRSSPEAAALRGAG